MRFAVALLAALALVPSAGATVNLTAVGTRVGDHPAFVRVVVEFTDGDLSRYDPNLLDAAVWGDGRTRLEVVQKGIRTEAPALTSRGVRVTFHQDRDRILIDLRDAARRFKYVSYFVLASPERLVVDLWKARPPTAAATIKDDGCLRLLRYSGGPGVSMEGLELRWLFEHTVVVRLRNARGRVIRQRPLIAGDGRWGTSFDFGVTRTQAATLEAVSESAKDGALECIVQVPVLLRA